MASMQEKLNRASINRSRKLFDRHIHRTAIKVQLLRLQRTKVNIRGDWTDTIVSAGEVEAYIDMPPDMPLSRARLAANPYPPSGDLPSFTPPTAPPVPTDEAPGTNLNFWDLLPIFIYVKWSDNIVTNDLLVYVFQDENGKSIPMVLRLVEELGAIHTHLVWRKAQAAVENSTLTASEMSAIQNYLNSGPGANPVVTGMSLNLASVSLSLATNPTVQLVASLFPADTTVTGISWVSSNPAVATVSSNGLVTAVSAGTALVTASSVVTPTILQTCSITVGP